MRSKEYEKFQELFDEVVNSNARKAFPNVVEILDPQEALNVLNRTSSHLGLTSPYYFKIQDLVHPRIEVTWYPKIFRNAEGMGGRFDGSGVILTSPRHDGVARVFTFHFCAHEWDESGANHSRGWHPKVCRKCGFDASIDSGD